MKKTRNYQDDQLIDLTKLTKNHQHWMLNSATGSGKTTVGKILVHDVLTNPKKFGINKIIIAAPFLTVAANFAVTKDEVIVDGSGKTRILKANSTKFVRKDVSKEVTDYLYNGGGYPLITTHSALSKIKIKSNVRLDGVLIIVDEAHHMFFDPKVTVSSINTQLGRVVFSMREKGATIGGMTATPFREDHNGRLWCVTKNFGGETISRTIGEQIRDGFSPSFQSEYVHVEGMKILDNKNKSTIFETAKSKMLPKDIKLAAKRVLELWKSDGYPKAIFLIPPGKSEENAEALTEIFNNVKFSNEVSKKRGRKTPSVLNAVGDNNGRDHLINCLKMDDEQNGHVYDFIIGCQKFNEGTDSASSSHLYQIGIPSKTVLRIQRAGRVLRSKNNDWAKYFGKQFQNLSKIVYLLPSTVEVEKMAHHLGRKIVHTIAATELPELYAEHAGSVVMKTLRQKKEKFSATQKEEYKRVSNDVTIANIQGAINEFSMVNPESSNKEIVEHVVNDLVKQGFDKTIATVLVQEVLVAEQNPTKKNKTLKRNPKGKDTYLKDSIDEFMSHRVSIDENSEMTRVWTKITGADFSKYAEQFKRSVNGGEKEAIEMCHEVFKRAKARGGLPLHKSKDIVERKDSSWLAWRRMARMGRGKVVFYPHFEQIAKQYGFPDAFEPDDNKQKAIEIGHTVFDWAMNNGKLPSKCSTDPTEKKYGDWLVRRRQCNQGKGIFYPELDVIAEQYGFPDAFEPNDNKQKAIDMCHEVLQRAKASGRLPIDGSKDGQWLSVRRGVKNGTRKGIFYPELDVIAKQYGFPDAFNPQK